MHETPKTHHMFRTIPVRGTQVLDSTAITQSRLQCNNIPLIHLLEGNPPPSFSHLMAFFNCASVGQGLQQAGVCMFVCTSK